MATVQKTQTTTPKLIAAKSPASGATAKAAPTAEQIAARAYAIWQETGCPEGCEQEHWYQAEAELSAGKGR
jgi:hypothetical protein